MSVMRWGSHMIDIWSVATVHWAKRWNGWEKRTCCRVLYFTIPVLFTLQQYFSICRCKDFEWNPQMSQIGLSQLCRGLALSAVLVQGYWNCFGLASPSWIETTRNLNRCRKGLKFSRSQAQSVPRTPSVYGGTLSPSPHHILSLTLYISPILSLISCSITFYTSSSLPPLCFHLSLFLYYPKSPPPATCGEQNPNVTENMIPSE